MNNVLQKLFPKEILPHLTFVYLFYVGLWIMVAITAYWYHLVPPSVGVFVIYASFLPIIGLMAYAYRRWDTFVVHYGRVFRILTAMVIVAILLISVSPFKPEWRPFDDPWRTLWLMLAMLAGLELFMWGIFLWFRRSEKTTKELLQRGKKAVASKLFGPGILAVQFMSPRRRKYYYLFTMGSFGVTTYAAFVLALNDFVATAIILWYGVIVFSALMEGVFTAEVTEKKAVESELEAARVLQVGLLPKEDPRIPGFDISGECLPANEVGGDFYDYVWLNQKKTKLGIAVADVSGKAMKAAMTAVLTSGMMYRELNGSGSPKTILRNINKPMYAKIDQRMFTALSFAVVDVKRRILRLSNAGQVYPLLKRRGKVIPLEVRGARLPLGVKENVTYNELTVPLRKGDVLVFSTDGIMDAMNKKEEFYGFERFRNLVSKTEGTAREIKDRIISDVRRFANGATQHDDMTVVVLNV